MFPHYITQHASLCNVTPQYSNADILAVNNDLLNLGGRKYFRGGKRKILLLKYCTRSHICLFFIISLTWSLHKITYFWEQTARGTVDKCVRVNLQI